MALIAPNLDNRTAQQLVDEAKKRIKNYCPEWTDHNVSDPGITLIELFAWMTEIMLYRFNQVPDRHYIKFLEMLGVRLKEPEPASTLVAFCLSEPLVEGVSLRPVCIPPFTEVATVQTETEPAIIFTTESELCIEPPELREILTGKAGDTSGRSMKDHNVAWFKKAFEGISVFLPKPEVDDVLCLGFDNDLSYHILSLDLDFTKAEGRNIEPSMPPYIWEASTGRPDKPWVELQKHKVKDNTGGMNEQGNVTLHLPRMGRLELNEVGYFWVRVRIKNISAEEKEKGMVPYGASPILTGIKASALGGAVRAYQFQVVKEELVGVSDGTPDQRFQLLNWPVLSRDQDMGEHLVVIPPGGEGLQNWKEVDDFADSTKDSPHYILDGVSGGLRFGPAIRQQDGTIRLYGAVPPRGARLVFRRYRYGGGIKGNLEQGKIETLKTSIPFVQGILQLDPAQNGRDAQDLEDAMVKAPAELRSSSRAVTAADYEFLIREKAGKVSYQVGRVKCIQPPPDEAGATTPGLVYVLVIPKVPDPPKARGDSDQKAGVKPLPRWFLAPEQLQPSEELVANVAKFLEPRRLLTTRLEIRAPQYQWVAARVRLRPLPGVDRAALKEQVEEQLYCFLNPLKGGPDGKGWEFGRDLFVSDLYQHLQGMPGVMYVRNIGLFNARPGGEAEGEPRDFIEVVSHGIVVSGRHQIEFI